MPSGELDSRHARVMQLLGDALELPAEQRDAFLQNASNDDPTLHTEVRRLLDGEHLAKDVMATGALIPAAIEAAEIESVGPYRVIRRLGQGGMGRVYLAEQESPIRRIVALKLIRPGMDSEEVIARFRSERQALARMNHPGVARVFDAGTTERDRPYFVMEYVEDGEPITEYCDKNELNIDRRIELFQQVCDAVHHAHQKGIIHRDLKPSNILVTRQGQSGGLLPKVIDFGIAKAITPDEATSEYPLATRHGQIIGTPDYMSPEQADTAVTSDVDTRSDIYSLGVVLHELLAGVLPAQRDATRMSARYNATATQEDIAVRRGTDASSLARTLRGDLDSIVLKAIDSDRARRYDSAMALAADLARYASHQPVTAAPPTARYRMRKFVRRHRGAVAAAVMLLCVLAGGILTTSWQAVLARRAEARAERRFNDVRKLTHTLLFDIHDQIANLNGATAVKDSLIQTSMKYLDEMSGEAAGDNSLQTELAIAYNKLARHLGRGGASRDVTTSVLAAHRKALAVLDRMGPAARPIDLAETNLWIAGALQTLGNVSEAIDTAEVALMSAERALAAAPDDMRAAEDVAGVCHLQGRLALQAGHREEAMTRLKRAESLMESKLALANVGEQDRREMQAVLALVSTELVAVYESVGDFSMAAASARRAVKIREDQSAAAPENRSKRRSLFLARIPLARVLQRSGEAQAAVVEARSALDLCRRLVQDDPRDSFTRQVLPGTVALLAACLAEAKQFDEAKKLFAESDADYRELESAKLLDAFVLLSWAKSLSEYAQLLVDVDHNPRGAVELHDRAIEKLRAVLSRDANNARSRADFAVALARRSEALLLLSGEAHLARDDRRALAVRARDGFSEIQNMSAQLKKDSLLPKLTEARVVGRVDERLAECDRRIREIQGSILEPDTDSIQER